MKTGEAAAILGIDRVTLYNWTENPLLRKYFSAGALLEEGGTQRMLTESDLLVLNTIRTKRSEKITKWEDIAAILESGERERDFPQNAISADRRTIPVQQAEQAARTMAVVTERDQSLARVNELTDQVEDLTLKLDREREKVNELLREMAGLQREAGGRTLLEQELSKRDSQIEIFMKKVEDLQREVGKLEGQLEMYRDQRKKLDADT